MSIVNLTSLKMGPNVGILFMFPVIIVCYPITSEIELAVKPDMREESVFPNGTVAGKYSYMDKEGNPVEVKYYADGANYGVELKSLKMVEGDSEKMQYSKQAKFDFASSDLSTAVPADATGSGFDYNYPVTDTKLKIPSDFFNDKDAVKHQAKDKTIDYDLPPNYYNPEPKKTRKDKIRIHNNKPNRVVRGASHVYKEPAVCEQY